MGMFSWQCKGCSKPLLADIIINKINGWMSDITVVSQTGKITHGSYDGYGRISGVDMQCDFEEADKHKDDVVPCYRLTEEDRFLDNGDGTMTKVNGSPKDYLTLWHTACWRNAGEPSEFQGHCLNAADQGVFFDEGTYDDGPPA